MAFSVKLLCALVSVIFQFLRTKQLEFEKSFDTFSFKRMDAAEKDSVSRLFCFKPVFLNTYNLKQILTIIIRIKLLLKSYGFL